LYRWKAAIKIQQIYRGFVIRKRLLAIRERDFAYVDSELDSLLCADLSDLLPSFDETEGEPYWSPSMQISSNNYLLHQKTLKLSFSERFTRENENNDSGANMHEKQVMSEWHINDARVAQVRQSRQRVSQFCSAS
jgi:hypothetical protein